MKPDFKRVEFELQDGVYCRMEQGSDPVPDRLKVERTRKQQYQDSGRTHLIRSLDTQPYRFMTGLDKHDSSGRIYYGNHLKADGKRSFCLFLFADDLQTLTVLYFNSYMVYPKIRKRFINQILATV